MSLHLIPLALTVVVVIVLGAIAIICSTSGGAQWLQQRWQGKAAALGGDGDQGEYAQEFVGRSGTDGLAGAADPLGNAIEGGNGGDGAQEGGLPRHPVDDA